MRRNFANTNTITLSLSALFCLAFAGCDLDDKDLGDPPLADEGADEGADDDDGRGDGNADESDDGNVDAGDDGDEETDDGNADDGGVPPDLGEPAGVPCFPLESECVGGEGCYWSGEEFVCAPTAGGFVHGEPCSFANDCADKHQCLPADVVPGCESFACCAEMCGLEPNDVPPCPDGTTCAPWFEEGEAPPNGFDDVGICVSG